MRRVVITDHLADHTDPVPVDQPLNEPIAVTQHVAERLAVREPVDVAFSESVLEPKHVAVDKPVRVAERLAINVAEHESVRVPICEPDVFSHARGMR